MAKVLDKRWKDWVHENVLRGCSREELFRLLEKEGFEYEAIRQELYPPAIARLERADSPRLELYTAPGFLDGEECRSLVELMKGRLRRSTITSEAEPDRFFRRSMTCDLGLIDHPLVREIDARICDGLRIHPSLGEPMQGQRYEAGDEFKAHTDYFEPYELERYSTSTLGQRTWTFMIYLNEPEAGGATAFVNSGIVVQPKTGTAVIWNNLLPDGAPNPGTLHHGMPVKAGWKAIVTKWFRCPRAA